MCWILSASLGYWHQRADERHGNPPPRQPGAISGQRQSWKTHRWAWGEQIHGMWYISLQCFDTVGWATGRASGLQKMDVGLLVVICTTAPVVQLSTTTTSITLSFNKHRLTKVHLENCRWNRERFSPHHCLVSASTEHPNCPRCWNLTFGRRCSFDWALFVCLYAIIYGTIVNAPCVVRCMCGRLYDQFYCMS